MRVGEYRVGKMLVSSSHLRANADVILAETSENPLVQEQIPEWLFLYIASLPLTRDVLIEVADLVGLLGIGSSVVQHSTISRGPKSRLLSGDQMVTVEPVLLWLEELLALRTAVRLWNASIEPKPKWKGILTLDNKRRKPVPFTSGERLPRSILDPAMQRFAPWPNEQLNKMAAAGILLKNALNRHISGATVSGLETCICGDVSSAKLAVEAARTVDYIWLQFALAVLGRKRYKSCSVCAALFDVSASGKRRDRLTCSDRCRVKAMRERRKSAI